MNTNQQRISDKLKALTSRQPGRLSDPKSRKRQVQEWLPQFEASNWYPDIFDALLLNSGIRVGTDGKMTCDRADVFAEVERLVKDYIAEAERVTYEAIQHKGSR
jgi:hypothetical protein